MITLFGSHGYRPEPEMMADGLPDCANCGCESGQHTVDGICLMAWDRWPNWIDCDCAGYKAAPPTGS